MNALPKMGRPRTTGLDWKLLGPREYQRLYDNQRRRLAGVPMRDKHGLSRKHLGHNGYMTQWRRLTGRTKGGWFTGLNTRTMSQSKYHQLWHQIKKEIRLTSTVNPSFLQTPFELL